MAELRKGSAWTWMFKLVDEYDFATPQVGRSPAVEISRNGGAFAAVSGSASEIGWGWYRVSLSAVETDADVLILRAIATGCAQADEVFYPPTQTADSAVASVADAVLGEPITDHKGLSGSLASAVNLICRAVAGKRDQTIATGVIRVFDSDGTTILATLTPGESGGVLTLRDA